MISALKKIFRATCKAILSEMLFDNLKYSRRHGYKFDLKNPQTLSEKIIWIKHLGALERFSKFVDKYEVRSFVKKRLGEQFLIPLVGVYDDSASIPFDRLPAEFIVKATHASGWSDCKRQVGA